MSNDPKPARPPSSAVRRPAALPGAALIGAALALALLTLAGLAIRDLTVRAGWVDGTEWLRGATHWGAESSWQPWMWPVAVAFVLVGAAMVWAAVKPRRHRFIEVSDGAAWTRPIDVARRASAVITNLPGVDGVTTLCGRKKITVRITARRGAVDEQAVREAVESVLADAHLTRTLKIKQVRPRVEETS